ncbi:MAG: L,D-transpeptidase family protein [Blastocatellia bacterium]
MKKILLLIALAAFAISLSAQIKKPEPPPVKIPFAESLQAVVVITKDSTATSGTAWLFERKAAKLKWKAVGSSFPIVVGRSGLAWDQDSSPKSVTELKKEGDGSSPAGFFPLTFAFGMSEKPSGIQLQYRKIDQFTECIDDDKSFHYNKIVGRMQVGIFDWKSSEKMIEITPEYDLGVFVAYNSYPVVKGNGSCIFLHIWKDANSPTSGCTAMERGNLEKITSWLDPKKNPYLVQLPEDQYSKYQKTWNLPKHK